MNQPVLRDPRLARNRQTLRQPTEAAGDVFDREAHRPQLAASYLRHLPGTTDDSVLHSHARRTKAAWLQFHKQLGFSITQHNDKAIAFWIRDNALQARRQRLLMKEAA